MKSKTAKLFFALAVSLLVTLKIQAKTHPVAKHEKIVWDYVEAFNQKDIDSMLKYTTDEIRWMSVSGESIVLETKGKKTLKESLVGYFKSTPSIHSKILTINTSGPFVYTVEKAQWESKQEVKSQCSPAVYQFDSNKISHVWYFESYVC